MIAVITLLVAVDPIGLARVWPKRIEISVYAAAALVTAALLADTVLDALDLSPEGFWIAAGLVLLVPAFGRLTNGGTRDVAGPAALLVAMSLATRDGTGETMVAAAVTALAVVLATTFIRGDARWAGIAERFVGAGMVVVALDLVRDGVIAV